MLEVVVIVLVPEVMVAVTGHTVVVSYVTTVVVVSSGTEGVEEEVALTPEGAGVVPALAGTDVVVLPSHLVQIVDVSVIVTVEMVLEVVVYVLEPEVIVAVTGQIVVVS